MNSLTIKILGLIVSLFILITIGSQISNVFNDRHETEEAVIYSVNDSKTFKAIAVRDEKLIDFNFDGVVNYIYSDGSKIAKNSVVAEVYRTKEQIIAKKRIEELENELSQLERAQNKGTIAVAQPEQLSRKIDESYKLITSLSEKGDISSLKAEKSNLLLLLNIYNLVTDEESDYLMREDYLKNEIKRLQSNSSLPLNTITISDGGYFVSYTDGYENKLTTQYLESITADEIKNIANSDINKINNKQGKIVSDYNWNLVAIVKTNNPFIENKKGYFKVLNSPDCFPGKVESVRKTDVKDEYIVVFSSDRLSRSFVESRVERVEFVFDEYKGIKVPREAIRFLDNQEGVFVVIGQKVVFKKVDVIYEGDDFILSKISDNSSFVMQYDEILVKGDGDFATFDSQ